MKVVVIVSALVLSVGVVSAYKFSRAGYESARYIEVEKEGPFEIRDYPPLTLISTAREGLDPSGSTGFMKLFRYISGANEAGRKIAMTTPVITTPEKQEWRMSFVVPAQVAAEGAPRPSNKDVRLETMPGGRFAVYRFSGSWEQSSFEESRETLARWLAARGIKAIAEAQIANYDPPFTPPMLRRNEILVRIGE